MATEVVFETHSRTEDNEAGRATGWLPGHLPPQGRAQAAQLGRFLGDLPLRWDGQRVLVIGHVATRWALDHLIQAVPLEELASQDSACQPGWEYRVG